jgi:hypothetical protein
MLGVDFGGFAAMILVRRVVPCIAALVVLAACAGPDHPRRKNAMETNQRLAGQSVMELESSFPLRVIMPARSYQRDELRDALAAIAQPCLDHGCVQVTRGQYEFFDLPGKSFTLSLLLFRSRKGARALFQKEPNGKPVCPVLGDENLSTPTRVAFYRGPFLVTISTDSPDNHWHKESLLLASQLDERLAGR